MVGRLVCLALCLTAGCKTVSHKLAHSPECQVEGECPADAECAPACAKKPQEVHVHVPRQKVVVNRGGACDTECDTGVKGRVAAARTRTRTIEEQQITQTRQVMLVPQQVLVPFVQTTTTGPIRVNGMSETQVLNVTGVADTTTTAAGLTMSRLTGAAATEAVRTDAAAAGAAAAGGPQTLAECNAQLRQYEERILKLAALSENLAAELKQIKDKERGRGPAPAANPNEPPKAMPPTKTPPGFPGESTTP